ncbi:MAG: M42 family metallopeptidase [Alicyclobacillus sp.]|nr:M42 family metallopeptidase [Alicyclobacillus sp.]
MEQTLRELTALVGPCGYEHDVARYLVNALQELGAEVQVDGVGNVIAAVRGAQPGPRLAVSTHMDEVGFVVKKVEPNGLLRFEKLGGHDDRILLAQQVFVASAGGIHRGVIGTISAHMNRFDDPTKVRHYRQLYIDVGATSRDEVAELGISVGDPIGWATEMQPLGRHRWVGKSFDDRAGCAVLLETLRALRRESLHGTVYGVFSVQEEVGLRGARVAGQHLDADVALAVDTTAVSDTPEEMMDGTLGLGAGVGIKVMDNSLVASVRVRRTLMEVARAAAIPYQLEVFTGIGTDAGELALSQSGVPTGVLSIPTRYAHAPVEVLDGRDLAATQRLLQAFIESMRDGQAFAFLA